jgi:hypothetical protein
MKTLPYLRVRVIAPLTYNKLNKAIKLLLTPESSISGEINRFRIGLDALMSVALRFRNTGDLEHPLGVVRIDINQAGYNELLRKRGPKKTLKVDSTIVKEIEEKVNGSEIVVTFITDYYGRNPPSTTHLHFQYDADLDPIQVGGRYRGDYALVTSGFWKDQANYCKAYRVKDARIDNSTNAFDLLFLDYLSQVMMIHLRNPLMDLYSIYKNA